MRARKIILSKSSNVLFEQVSPWEGENSVNHIISVYRHRGRGRFMPPKIKNFFPFGTSLVVQWLRIHLPMQGTQLPALVQEDPTCRGATKPVRHNY